jgi:hypothetical protein
LRTHAQFSIVVVGLVIYKKPKKKKCKIKKKVNTSLHGWRPPLHRRQIARPTTCVPLAEGERGETNIERGKHQHSPFREGILEANI